VYIGTQVAARIRQEVESEAGVTCSCGIAVNKMLAKVGGFVIIYIFFIAKVGACISLYFPLRL